METENKTSNKLLTFAEIKKRYVRGIDYDIKIQRVPNSCIAIIAPHGGYIEEGTSEITKRIAKKDMNSYIFEGYSPKHSFENLHITSHLFDEPKCLSLIKNLPHVVTIHGCQNIGKEIFIGGLDYHLKKRVSSELLSEGLKPVLSGHNYAGVHPKNICNRGLSGKGVQIEVSYNLLFSHNNHNVIRALRKALKIYSSPNSYG